MEESRQNKCNKKNLSEKKIIEQSRTVLLTIAQLFCNEHISGIDDNVCLQMIHHILSNESSKELMEKVLEKLKNQKVTYYTPSLRNKLDQNTHKKVSPLIKNSFRTIKTPGDGHCFYNAVSYTLFKNTNFYLVIRLLCIKFILDNLDYFKCLKELCAIDSIATLIQNIAALDIVSNQQWGDNNSVIALSLGLQREFFVNLIYEDKSTVTMFHPSSETVINSPIFLVLNGNHYSSLLPMVKGQHLYNCLNQIRQECINKNMIQKLDVQELKSIFESQRNSSQSDIDYVDDPHMEMDIKEPSKVSHVLLSPKRGIKRKNNEETIKNHKKHKLQDNVDTEHMAFLKIYFKYRQDELKRYEFEKKFNKLSAAKLRFLKQVSKMPDNICICCEGLFYKIKRFDISTLYNSFNKKHVDQPELLISFEDFEKCIKNADIYTGLCHTCYNNINRGKIPILSTSSSGLKLPNLPDCVKNLTELEERIVCPYVNFIKFVCLKSYDPNAQLGAKGSVINVPTDVEEMVTTLPRSFDECKYVHIVFKRKLEHETKFLEENVNVQRIIDALTYLQDTPLYKEYGIKIDLTRLNTFEGKTYVPVSELDKNIKVAIQDMLKEEEDDEDVDPGQPDFDALVVKNLIIDDDCKDKKIIMAPGEGKKPIPRFKINNYDRLIMPSIFGGQPEPFVNRKPSTVQNDPEDSDDSEFEYDKPLSRTKKFKSWLRNYDTRIRKSRYVLHMAKVKLEEQVLSGKSIMLRKSAGKTTVADLLNDKNVENLVSNDQAFKMFTSVRGSPTYWSQKRKDIFCMFRQFGPATLFFTLSQGEAYEPILLQYMFKLQKRKDISLEEAIMLDESVKAELIRNDPVSCAEFFNNKLKEFMKYLKSKTGPFKDNPIEHYLWRIEYQMRGTMHAHGMLWLKDAPKFNPDDTSTFEENESFIDKYISVFKDTSIPLLSFQQHRHTFCCNKGKKNKKRCRFNFPKPPMEKTKILIPLPDDISNVEKEFAKTNFKLLSNKLKFIIKKNNFNQFKNLSYEDFLKYVELNEENYLLAIRSSIKEPTVFYKRNVYSIMTNNYSEDWLIWNSNLDVQFLHNSYRAVYYVGEYIGKDPAGVSNIILEAKKKAEKGNVTYEKMLKMVAESFINFNFMSAQEAVNQIMGYAFFQNSESVVYIDTKPMNDRTRIKKSKKELQKIYKTNPDSLDVFIENQIDRYPRRPKLFESLCLAEYVALLNIKKTQKKASINEKENASTENEFSDLEEEQNIKSNNIIEDGYEYCVRRKPKCINWLGYKEEQDPLNYYREMIMLFLPWRDEKEDVESCNLEIVYEKHFNEIKSNYDKYVKTSPLELEKVYDTVQNDRKDLEKEDEDFEKVNAVSKSQEVILDEPINDSKTKKDQIERINHYKINEKIQFRTVQEKMQKLNKRQREIIMHFIKCYKEGRQELVVLLGSGGYGKSFLIDTLSLILTYMIKKRPGTTNDNINVLITAPTGKAAFNVNGYTNHHAFVLPVTKYYKINQNGLPNLNSSLVNTLSCAFKDLSLWINDEISMVGTNQFTFIDTRLKQIKNSSKPFGGLSCLLAGDFKQLAPVGDKYIFKSNTKENSRSYLWDLFSGVELTESMRIKDDLAYAKAVENIGKGEATAEDIALVNTRKVKFESDVPKEAIWLYYTNAEVDNYNNLKINESKEKAYEILPHDSFPKNISKKVQAKLKNHLNTLNVDDMGGLPNAFILKLGIKYMITANVNIEDGLCNGACGTVKFLSTKDRSLDSGENIETIWMDFGIKRVGKLAKMKINKPEDMTDEDYSACVPIQRYTQAFIPPNYNVSVTRTQFPLRASEACTIHKSQCQTCDNGVCIDVRAIKGKKKQTFRTQLLYVAVTRITSSSNLYILGNIVISNNLEKSAIEALSETKRLLAERPLKLSFETFDKKDKGLIVYHNCQSLVSHYDDIKADHWYFKADVLILSETNSKISDKFDFPGFTVFHRTDGIERLTGRGVLYYVKNQCTVEVLFSNHSNPKENHCDLTLFKIGTTNVISGYRSPKCSVKVLTNELSNLLTYIPVGSNIIFLGDMNESGKALVEKLLLPYGCLSVMPDNIVTTDFNTDIDIVLTNDKNAKSGTYESYFSYHKPIYIYTDLVQKLEKRIKTENIYPLVDKKSSNDPKERMDLIKITNFQNGKTVSNSSSKLLEKKGIKMLDRILDYDEEILDEIQCIDLIFKYLSSNKTLNCFENHLKRDKTIKISNEKFSIDLHPLLNPKYGSIDVKGDGTCFYRAISYTVFRTEDYHPWIRLIAIKSLIQFKEYFIKLTSEIFNDCTFYNLIIQSANLKTFAENMTVYALCVGLSRNILINICSTTLISNGERLQNEIQVFSVNSNNNLANSIMLRLSGQHYKAILLQPRQLHVLSLNIKESCFINVLKIFNMLKENISKSSQESSLVSKNMYVLNEDHIKIIRSIELARPTDVIIFKFGLKITKDQLNSLNPGVWLNSDIVNFYLKLLMQRCDKLKNLPSIYSFESYFLNALSHSFIRAKHWIKNINIFTFAIILIPVHVGENHWCLIAVYTEQKLICYYDSMHRTNDSILSKVQTFLERLAKNNNVKLNSNSWKIEYSKNCPLQNNSDDCGVFCLTIAEHLTRTAPLTFRQEHMSYFRKKIMYEIIMGNIL